MRIAVESFAGRTLGIYDVNFNTAESALSIRALDTDMPDRHYLFCVRTSGETALMRVVDMSVQD